MMRRLTAFLTAIALSVSLYSIVQASGNAVIRVTNAEAVIGDMVTVDVVMENNPGIMAMQMYVEYDEGLELVEVKKGDALSSMNYIGSGQRDIDPYVMLWDGLQNDSSNGTIAELTFRVSENADGADMTVRAYSGQGLIYDYDMNDVEVEFVPGTVTLLSSDMTSDETETVSTTEKPTSSSSSGSGGSIGGVYISAPTATTTALPTDAPSVMTAVDSGGAVTNIEGIESDWDTLVIACYNSSGKLISVSNVHTKNTEVKLNEEKENIDMYAIYAYIDGELDLIQRKTNINWH